jgi:hypothetical protein
MKQEKENVSRDFAIAYFIFKHISSNPNPTERNELIQLLTEKKVREKKAVGIINLLVEKNLIRKKIFGRKQSSFKHINDSIKSVFILFKQEWSIENQLEVENKIKGSFEWTYDIKKTCEVCKVLFKGKNDYCEDCSEYNEPLYNDFIQSKCGHSSLTRYFHCEQCKPELESDNEFFDVNSHSIGIAFNESYD